jgi:hypothetical protein
MGLPDKVHQALSQPRRSHRYAFSTMQDCARDRDTLIDSGGSRLAGKMNPPCGSPLRAPNRSFG